MPMNRNETFAIRPGLSSARTEPDMKFRGKRSMRWHMYLSCHPPELPARCSGITGKKTYPQQQEHPVFRPDATRKGLMTGSRDMKTTAVMKPPPKNCSQYLRGHMARSYEKISEDTKRTSSEAADTVLPECTDRARRIIKNRFCWSTATISSMPGNSFAAWQGKN